MSTTTKTGRQGRSLEQLKQDLCGVLLNGGYISDFSPYSVYAKNGASSQRVTKSELTKLLLDGLVMLVERKDEAWGGYEATNLSRWADVQDHLPTIFTVNATLTLGIKAAFHEAARANNRSIHDAFDSELEGYTVTIRPPEGEAFEAEILSVAYARRHRSSCGERGCIYLHCKWDYRGFKRCPSNAT